MRKTGTWTTLVLAVSFIFVNACAMRGPILKVPTPDGPLKVVRRETPSFGVVSKGAGTAAGIAGVCMGPPAILAAHAIIRKPLPASEGIVLPDYLKLVMDGFTERISKEVSDWPEMEIIDRPIAKKHKYKVGQAKSKYRADARPALLEFMMRLDGPPILQWHQGFMAITVMQLKDSNGEIIWRIPYTYWSRKHERAKTIEEFLANEGQLLREEMIHAADCTVSEFFNLLIYRRRR